MRRIVDTVGFEVLPRAAGSSNARLLWLNRDRRLAKDFEATIASAQGFGLYRFQSSS